MKTYKDLYTTLCSYENLILAFKKARKRKTLRPYVIEFEKDLMNNILRLQTELLLHSYRPQPLKTFILRDPKTRKISKSDFRDRIVHHALCNIIEPILEKSFIHDSYANRKGKGTLAAINRFEHFKIKVSKNFTTIKNTKNIKGFVFKADIRKCFDSVSHDVLINTIKRKIKDVKIIWLIKTILSNHKIKEQGKGMPLGNLTSQFFANVYLNNLDQFIKHRLKAKYYIRYVDDFVIMHYSREQLESYKEKIACFLKNFLELKLHPEKSRIIPLYRGTPFLGLTIFSYHKTIQKKNIRKFKNRFSDICAMFDKGIIEYNKVYNSLEGWIAYSKNSQSYSLRTSIIDLFKERYKTKMSSKEMNRHLKTMIPLNE